MWFRRIFKYLFFTVIFLTLLVIAALIAIPYLISTDAIRIRLAQDLSAWTGYNVQLRDPPDISFFPTLKASLSGVTLSDASDDTRPLMTAECIEVDLSLIAALQGKVSFSETRIIRPHFSIDEPVKTVAGFFVSLSRSEGSLGNAIRQAKEIVEKNPKNTDISSLLAQPFGRIVIQDGTLSYPIDAHKNDDDERGEITQINSTITWPASTYAATIKSSGRWNGAYTEVSLRADQALVLMAGGKSNMSVSANSNRGGISFTGEAQFAQNFSLNGSVAVRLPALNVTMEWLGQAKSFGANIQLPIVWESNLNATSEKLELNDVNLSFGNDKARGALETVFINELPLTSGSLAFQTLDFTQILPAFMPGNDSVPDLSFLERFAMDLRVSTPQGKIGNITVANFAASTQLRNGRFILDIGNADVFDGTLQGNIMMSLINKVIHLETRLSTSKVSLEKIQAALSLDARLKCAVNMTMNATSDFISWSALFLNAKGAFDANCNNGTVSGLDFIRITNSLANEEKFPLFSDNDKVLNFKRLFTKGTIVNGDVKVDVATLDFDNHWVDFTGQASLQKGDVDLIGAIDRPKRIGGRCIDVECLRLSLQPLRRFTMSGLWNSLNIQAYAVDDDIITPNAQ